MGSHGPNFKTEDNKNQTLANSKFKTFTFITFTLQFAALFEPYFACNQDVQTVCHKLVIAACYRNLVQELRLEIRWRCGTRMLSTVDNKMPQLHLIWRLST